ncbi:MAG: 16S rRNA (cytidine(1402)-2'-O)-methyltransferase, partial [Oscillospiraceae bacterium]
ATPIGNLSDLTPRMKQVFETVDFIAAEDTRVTVKLLNHFGIKKPMISYYEHNIKDRGDYIIDRIVSGESCAVCSDAGTPCISDPGEVLVAQAHERGVRTVPISGPSAVITALCVSGQSTGRFCFEGFLSTSKKQRTEHLKSLEKETRTMVFYEAPHKLLNTLKDFVSYFGQDRKLTLARELTKLHEEIKLTTTGQALDFYSENSPKGEFVLVLAGAVLQD